MHCGFFFDIVIGMKTKILSLLPLTLLLAACPHVEPNPDPNPDPGPGPINVPDKYGAFLGRSENNINGFENYKYISIETEEYNKATIKKLSDQDTYALGYVNVGSVETYRSYYKQFESITFADYENWPDEKWVDVSQSTWQDFVVNTIAKNAKDKGFFGVYLDNVDVYSVCKEMDRPTAGVVTGLKNIISGINNLGLKVMMNGGAEFLDDMFDKNDKVVNSIWGYHQEEVFSLITDYDKDIFGTQIRSDREYYQEISAKMKKIGANIFYLEYTKDSSLILSISNYCNQKGYYYYYSTTVDLL